ncbi:MAG: FGGY-family carbohydrate kinase, partial [Cellulosilyticaceae bacterium]
DCMQTLVMPGTVVGTLGQAIQEETGLGPVKVVAVGSHDTASAVAATPLESEEEIYLVCGTWCLMGMEVSQPNTTQAAKGYGLTNEGGIDGKVRLLKNINGLWFLQQLRKCWNEQGLGLGFPDIIQEVRSTTHEYAIDAADERFMAPKNMIVEVVTHIEEKYGVTLQTVGEIAKAAYNGLGILYGITVNQFEELTSTQVEAIRMIGGGIQDQYLCETVAKVTGKKVITGPIEASAIGNILVQLRAVGEVDSLAQMRKLVTNSFEMKIY